MLPGNLYNLYVTAGSNEWLESFQWNGIDDLITTADQCHASRYCKITDAGGNIVADRPAASRWHYKPITQPAL